MKRANFNKTIILAVLLIPILFCSSGKQEERLAFCGFSIKKGGFYGENITMGYINQMMEYIVKESTVGDETGIADVVESIKKVIGINVPFVTYISKGEDNAFATVVKGRRILVIDHMFMHTVNKGAGTEWAAISIIAHEIGHHVAGFSRRPTQHEAEFDADYWSGYILQKLGSSEEAATKCIMRYGSEIDTKSHPNKYSRSSAIKKGWQDAKKGYLDKDRCQSYY